MAQPQVLEGTWEEILSHNASQLAGRKVKITIEPEGADMDASAFPPNEQALAMLRDLVKLQEGMKESSGEETNSGSEKPERVDYMVSNPPNNPGALVIDAKIR